MPKLLKTPPTPRKKPTEKETEKHKEEHPEKKREKRRKNPLPNPTKHYKNRGLRERAKKRQERVQIIENKPIKAENGLLITFL
jgi:hypothetical protein